MLSKDDPESIAGVFAGNRSSRTLYWVITALFSAFPIAGLFLAVSSHGKVGPILISLVSILLGGGLMAACLQNIFAASSTVRLSEDGIRVDTPLGSRVVKWASIERITQGDRSAPVMKLYLPDGGVVPLRLDCFEDGKELGRRIKDRFVRNPVAPVSDSRVYRKSGLAFFVFICSIAFLLYVGGSLAALIYGRQGSAPRALISLLSGLAYCGLIIKNISTFVRLGSSELVIGNLYKTRVYPLDRVERLTIAGDGSGSTKFWVAGKPIGFPSNLEDWDELRQRLLAVLPVEESKPTPKVFTESTEILEFKPRRSFLGEMGFMLAFFLALTCSGLWLMFGPEKNGFGIGLFTTLLFGSILVVMVFVSLNAYAGYRLDGGSIERVSRYKPWRIPLSEIESAWRAGDRLENVRLQVKGKRIEIDTYPFADRGALAEALVGPRPFPVQPGRYGFKTQPYMLMGCGMFFTCFSLMIPTMSARPLVSSDFVGLAFCGLFGFVIAFGGFAWLKLSYETMPDGLIRRTLTGRRLLRFEDIKRLEIDTFTTKNGVRRRLRVEHPEGGVALAATVEDFPLIEAYLIANLPAEKVHDSTVASDYVKTG